MRKLRATNVTHVKKGKTKIDLKTKRKIKGNYFKTKKYKRGFKVTCIFSRKVTYSLQ